MASTVTAAEREEAELMSRQSPTMRGAQAGSRQGGGARHVAAVQVGDGLQRVLQQLLGARAGAAAALHAAQVGRQAVLAALADDAGRAVGARAAQVHRARLKHVQYACQPSQPGSLQLQKCVQATQQWL